MRKISFIILVFIIYFPAYSEAQVSYPERKQEYVNDFTDVLGNTALLEEEIKEFELDTSNKINIAVLHSLGDVSIDKYADKLYEKWRVGKDRDNGILILVCLQDKRIYIKVGYGLVSSISPEVTQAIIDNEINPSFQESMYLEGLEKGNKAIMAAIIGEYEKSDKNNYSSIVFVVILISVFIFLFIFSNIKSKRKKTRNNLRKIRNI